LKFCQSCAERGYGTEIPATREWKKDYFICEDCFQPLADNVFGNDNLTQGIKGKLPEFNADMPLLNQFYNLTNLPPSLRFNKQDDVLKNREQIFNYQAPMVENLELVDLTAKIEEFKVIFSTCKLLAEPIAEKIKLLKSQEREKYHLSGEEKSLKEVTKIKKSTATLSQKEKLARSLNVTVEELDRMQSVAKGLSKTERENQFNTLIGKPSDGTCRKPFINDGKPAICKLSDGHTGAHSAVANAEGVLTS
jgi:hypothetical protein